MERARSSISGGRCSGGAALNALKPLDYHLDLGRRLAPLREREEECAAGLPKNVPADQTNI
jgi:hypothetical protein